MSMRTTCKKAGRFAHAAITLPSGLQRQLKLVAEPLNLRWWGWRPYLNEEGTDHKPWCTSKESAEAAGEQQKTATQALSGHTEAANTLEPFSTGRNECVRHFRGRRVEEPESNVSNAHEPLVTTAAMESETLTDVIGKELTGYASEATMDVMSVIWLLKMHSNSVAKPSLSQHTNHRRFLSGKSVDIFFHRSIAELDAIGIS